MADKQTVQVRMLRSARISQDGFHDGYARVGQVVNVSPLVAQDWAYCQVCEYVNTADKPADYQPDARLREANKIATPNMQEELNALKAQVAALMAVKATSKG